MKKSTIFIQKIHFFLQDAICQYVLGIGTKFVTHYIKGVAK